VVEENSRRLASNLHTAESRRRQRLKTIKNEWSTKITAGIAPTGWPGLGAHFVIADVAYIGPSFQALALWGTCRSSADCVERDDGSTNDLIVGVARKAVAHMQFVSRGSVYICSGGLLADNDTSTERNYFLTANHCISRGKEANSLETFFHYTECGTDGSAPAATDGVGAKILAGGSSTDFTLLELNGTVPNDTMRLSWNAKPVAGTNGQSLYRISHPNGAPQSYSEHKVDTTRPTCSTWPRGPRIYSSDIDGATEGGSSGSLVLNSDGDVVGQLSGACGYNTSDSCDASNNATVDGAFAAYFSQVSQWLVPETVTGGNRAPVANFTWAPNQSTELAIDFDDTSTDNNENITAWNWDFGDTYSSTKKTRATSTQIPAPLQ
jgi:V8-like Glu-specific endopeptidase